MVSNRQITTLGHSMSLRLLIAGDIRNLASIFRVNVVSGECWRVDALLLDIRQCHLHVTLPESRTLKRREMPCEIFAVCCTSYVLRGVWQACQPSTKTLADQENTGALQPVLAVSLLLLSN